MNGYLYDPHTHTAETSKCGHLFAAEVVDRYVRNGFSGLVVTDHLHPEYLSRIDTQHNWDMVMDHYLTGYHASKKRGDEVGLDVILGAEFRFPENDNDYLVYGIDEQWLRSNPYACCMSAQEFYDKYHNEVLIIHAHPFRKGSAPVQELLSMVRRSSTTILAMRTTTTKRWPCAAAIPNITAWRALIPTGTAMRPVRASFCRNGLRIPAPTSI